ncbi:MAG: DUF5337 family protein [Litoreibacter sp.]
MTHGRERDTTRAKKGRQLALVSVVATLGFLGGEFAGAVFGWPSRMMALLELGFAAAFLWVMINAYLLWRSGQA